MSTSVQLDPETTKLYHPVSLVCKFPVDQELVLKCQQYGGGRYRGKAVGHLPALWPHDSLKQIATQQATMFVRHMELKGYMFQQAITEMELWGPYREKLSMDKADTLINWEQDNHLIPEGHWGPPSTGWEYDGVRGPRKLDAATVRDHQDWKRGTIFLVRGKFLATRGKQEESTGILIV